MSKPRYLKNGFILQREDNDLTKGYVSDLQEDLRKLGYLKKNIDGKFGWGTELAVKALQYDLLYNAGVSTSNDGLAPVRVIDYNRGRISDIAKIVDSNLAGCIADMLNDPDFPKLPNTADPRQENQKIISLMKQISGTQSPIPFIMGILKQESGLKHFFEPSDNDKDTYIVIGQDTNASLKYNITSRGYGAGQYTLFHHPPKPEEINDFMLDVESNIQKAIEELRYKFDHFVNGNTSGTRADDRIVEYGQDALRICKYQSADSRYMRDCRQCMVDAGQYDIQVGITPWYEGSGHKYTTTQYYKALNYKSVPIRKNIGCDWPYAARRYNGSGVNSYHYQTRVMKNICNL